MLLGDVHIAVIAISINIARVCLDKRHHIHRSKSHFISLTSTNLIHELTTSDDDHLIRACPPE